MPRVTLATYKLNSYAPDRFSIDLGLGRDNPHRTVEIRSVAECEAAIKAFATEVETTGKPWMVSAVFDKRSGRKPAGFDAAAKANKLRAFVNTHLAQG